MLVLALFRFGIKANPLLTLGYGNPDFSRTVQQET